MSFRYIDSHVHFWDRELLAYPWLDSLPRIATPHLPGTFQTETNGAAPEKIVFLQCVGEIASWRAEVEWVELLARDEPRIAGIVATAPMDAGLDTLRILDDLSSRSLVKGVRHNTQDEPLGFARSAAYVAGCRAAGARGLSVDLCAYHSQLPDLVQLARACPNTRFILDHLGKPGIRAGLIDPWRENISALAALPNVWGKLSGIVTEADKEQCSSEYLKPYVAHYLEAFGPDRVIFGSDWPVVKLASTHGRWFLTALELTCHLSEDERDRVFYRNAAAFYRLN